MKLTAQKDFSLNGVFYEVGDEVKIKDIKTLITLNEKGFIEPLTPKQIQDFGKPPKVENKSEKKEEE